MPTRILALDTSTEACSVALCDGDDRIAQSEICPKEHTRKILPMIDAVLTEAGLSLNQLDAIAFGRGPGSFTGVRISVSIAQGLALGADLPLLAISTLKTLAQGTYRLTGATQVLSVIDARMHEIYWCEFQQEQSGLWLAIGEEKITAPEKLTELMMKDKIYSPAGSGWVTYPELLSSATKTSESHYLFPLAEDMLILALRQFENHECLTVDEALPVYLRNEVTWKKLPGRQ